ncbi:DUF3710 domain-containing protein [Aeromicrobium ginsengisoli]|uniref:DUF3710 domain-containing protein n=1 Tax=Aeromicrobium ginsengisoli TaxID=363867 RepID=A0A5M4FHL1_9ACTN|nr:DUF3710 domain-containing protein [Aeromicrobium ginsengisoli]KAA1399617.1 DUF3710 domain-containing protein [Aeromicrobium ginsengisoli]
MVRRRKQEQSQDEVESEETTPDVRANGPWDISEKTPDGDDSYVDLGPLLVRARDAYSIQLPAEGEAGQIASAVLVAEDSALELRAFAATRSGGLWDEVRDDLILEVARLEGECEQVDGLFGPELRVSVPVDLSDGEKGFQPSRIVAVEGPRWLLRGTFLGEVGLNPVDDGPLMDAFKDVIVVRGVEARIPREALLLTLPDNAVATPDEE